MKPYIFLLGKLFKKTCEDYITETSSLHTDGSYHPFECLVNQNKIQKIINLQADLMDTVLLVDKEDIKEFIGCEDVKEGLNILKGTSTR